VKKWSLIIFSILSQMAVGAFWVLMVVREYFGYRYGLSQADSLILSPLLVVETIMVFSLPISLAHLGSPLIAYRAIFNLRSSWLSREISFALLFASSIVAFTYLIWGQIGATPLRSTFAWMAEIFGFLLIYAMSRLYMLRTVPVWNTFFTPVSFFLTTLILGVLLVGATFIGSRGEGSFFEISLVSDALVKVTTGALIFLGAEFVLVFSRVLRLLNGTDSEKIAIQKLFARYRNVFFYRVFFGIAGFICLLIMLIQTHYSLSLYILCFLLILIAEIAERFLFYSARDVSGI